MSMRSRQTRALPLRVAAAILLLGLAALASNGASHAQGAGQLRTFQGRWSGAGTLARDNGAVERLRCQADYVVLPPSGLRQTISCRGDRTNFDFVSNVAEIGGELSGDWLEINRNARGSLAGRLTGSGIAARVDGAGFSAEISIGLKANRQSVDIRSHGGDISRLSISLARSGR